MDINYDLERRFATVVKDGSRGIKRLFDWRQTLNVVI